MFYIDHGFELYELSNEKRNFFLKMQPLLENQSPKLLILKFNYGTYRNTLSHLHVHIVPKYKESYGFGTVFEMNPQENVLIGYRKC